MPGNGRRARQRRVAAAALRGARAGVSPAGALGGAVSARRPGRQRGADAGATRGCGAAGCELHEGEEVGRCRRGRPRGRRRHRRRPRPCNAVVNALGAWAARLRGPTPVPVHPVRGQIAVLRAARPPFRHAIYSGRGYAVSRRDGRILLGSTREAAGFEKRVTARRNGGRPGRRAGAGAAARRDADCRDLGGAAPGDGRTAGRWSGRDDGGERLRLATGHYRNGVLLAPITAQLVARCCAAKRTRGTNGCAPSDSRRSRHELRRPKAHFQSSRRRVTPEGCRRRSGGRGPCC